VRASREWSSYPQGGSDPGIATASKWSGVVLVQRSAKTLGHRLPNLLGQLGVLPLQATELQAEQREEL
jgi:hypothetical protein